MKVSPEEILVEAGDLHFSFGSGAARREVLHGVSASFRAGEITLITGPSGSGKTTFLTLIGALRRLQEGKLKVFGRDLKNVSSAQLTEIRRAFGYIFQHHNLVPALTACENVQLAFGAGNTVSSGQARKLALEILATVGLKDEAGKRPNQLSGGQKQRVGIARALVTKPRVILADEPTASLDGVTGREIVDLLRRLACEQKCAVILVTHDNRILDIADRLLSLTDGNLEESQLGLLRVAKLLQQGAAHLPFYLPSAAGGNVDLPERRSQFDGDLNRAQSELALWQQRSLSREEKELTGILQSWLSDLRGLEAALLDFLEVFQNSASLPGAERMRDAGLQALETLLLTCVEQMREPDEDGLAMLAAATQSGGNFSQSYLASRLREQQELSEHEMRLLLNFTGVLAQSIFFLRELAEVLRRRMKMKNRL